MKEKMFRLIFFGGIGFGIIYHNALSTLQITFLCFGFEIDFCGEFGFEFINELEEK